MPLRVLLIALLLAPLGLAACGDDAPVTRAEGEPCVEAHNAYRNHIYNSTLDAERDYLGSDPAEDERYLAGLRAVLDDCTPRTLLFAQNLEDTEFVDEYGVTLPGFKDTQTYDGYLKQYDEDLKTYCDARDRYRETDRCEGVPQ